MSGNESPNKRDVCILAILPSRTPFPFLPCVLAVRGNKWCSFTRRSLESSCAFLGGEETERTAVSALDWREKINLEDIPRLREK